MDRRNFINHGYISNEAKVSDCGLDDCECETGTAVETREPEKTSSSSIVLIAILALLCGSFISMLKIEAGRIAVTANLLQKKETAISCQPLKKGDIKMIRQHQPADENDKSCFHQTGGCLCENKRRQIKL